MAKAISMVHGCGKFKLYLQTLFFIGFACTTCASKRIVFQESLKLLTLCAVCVRNTQKLWGTARINCVARLKVNSFRTKGSINLICSVELYFLLPIWTLWLHPNCVMSSLSGVTGQPKMPAAGGFHFVHWASFWYSVIA